MTARISQIAPPGSLLKVNLKKPDRKQKFGRQPGTVTNANYLALLRRCPCISCDADPAGVAAHVRLTIKGKPIAGTGRKPADEWALPLCRDCHTDGPKAQHKVGEMRFWNSLGLDPLAICRTLYRAAPDIEAMRSVIFKSKEERI